MSDHATLRRRFRDAQEELRSMGAITLNCEPAVLTEALVIATEYRAELLAQLLAEQMGAETGRWARVVEADGDVGRAPSTADPRQIHSTFP